jgi:hypothetical protein
VPQAIITAQVFFGNKAQPQGQGVMPWLNLSDFASWFPQDYQIDGSNRKLGVAPIPFRGKSYVVSDDFDGKSLIVPMKYYEGPGVSLGAAKAQLSQAGEQYLSFDNKVTATLVRLKSFGTPVRTRKFSPFWWDLPGLEFFAKEPFFADVASTTPAGFPIGQGGAVAPGTTVTTAIVYAGSVRTWPIFTLNVPAGNGVVINQLVLKNNMSGETLTITFGPPLAAATAYTITIDCEAQTVVDSNGVSHDFVGSFPVLYGPAGQSQNIATTLITASGTSTSVTVGCSFANRWEI